MFDYLSDKTESVNDYSLWYVILLTKFLVKFNAYLYREYPQASKSHYTESQKQHPAKNIDERRSTRTSYNKTRDSKSYTNIRADLVDASILDNQMKQEAKHLSSQCSKFYTTSENTLASYSMNLNQDVGKKYNQNTNI